MTAAQLLDARMLIPGAYEPNAPPHRAAQPAPLAPAAPVEIVQAHPAAAPYVVAAPAQPTTGLGRVAAMLSDVGLVTGIIFAVSLGPALILMGIKAAAALILQTVGGR